MEETYTIIRETKHWELLFHLQVDPIKIHYDSSLSIPIDHMHAMRFNPTGDYCEVHRETTIYIASLRYRIQRANCELLILDLILKFENMCNVQRSEIHPLGTSPIDLSKFINVVKENQHVEIVWNWIEQKEEQKDIHHLGEMGVFHELITSASIQNKSIPIFELEKGDLCLVWYEDVAYVARVWNIANSSGNIPFVIDCGLICEIKCKDAYYYYFQTECNNIQPFQILSNVAGYVHVSKHIQMHCNKVKEDKINSYLMNLQDDDMIAKFMQKEITADDVLYNIVTQSVDDICALSYNEVKTIPLCNLELFHLCEVKCANNEYYVARVFRREKNQFHVKLLGEDNMLSVSIENVRPFGQGKMGELIQEGKKIKIQTWFVPSDGKEHRNLLSIDTSKLYLCKKNLPHIQHVIMEKIISYKDKIENFAWNRIKYKRCGKFLVCLFLPSYCKTNEDRDKMENSHFAKFRCDQAFCIFLLHLETMEFFSQIEHAFHKIPIHYEVGCFSRCHKFFEFESLDKNVICGPGIHYFNHWIAACFYNRLDRTAGVYISFHNNGMLRYVAVEHHTCYSNNLFNWLVDGLLLEPKIN